jgi:rubrerythrin
MKKIKDSVDLSHVDRLNFPGFSPDYEKNERKEMEKSKAFRELKLMYSGAKNFCPECKTPIFDDGKCPVCN